MSTNLVFSKMLSPASPLSCLPSTQHHHLHASDAHFWPESHRTSQSDDENQTNHNLSCEITHLTKNIRVSPPSTRNNFDFSIHPISSINISYPTSSIPKSTSANTSFSLYEGGFQLNNAPSSSEDLHPVPPLNCSSTFSNNLHCVVSSDRRTSCAVGHSKIHQKRCPQTPTIKGESILEQLKNGQAQFELISSPVASVSSSMFITSSPRNLFFAKIGGKSEALKKVESYSVQRVTGDGRCMFRALVKGMALNKGLPLSSRQEREDADELQMAVKEVICDKNNNERRKYEEALVAITVEEPLRRYCQRIGRPDFWGGESELLVLSRLCCQPIIVYIPEHEHGSRGSGFIPIAEYGSEFNGSRKGKKAVRLLYSGKNHYDLLV